MHCMSSLGLRAGVHSSLWPRRHRVMNAFHTPRACKMVKVPFRSGIKQQIECRRSIFGKAREGTRGGMHDTANTWSRTVIDWEIDSQCR